jgi:hypothetical protein
VLIRPSPALKIPRFVSPVNLLDFVYAAKFMEGYSSLSVLLGCNWEDNLAQMVAKAMVGPQIRSR